MTVVYVLGVCVSAGECGGFLKLAVRVLLVSIILHGVKRKRLTKGAVALLFVLSLAGGLRYQLAQRSYQQSEARIRIFDGLRVRLSGELEEYTEAGGKAKLRIRNAVLSSAYGDKNELPATATSAMRARYDQPVGTILVYMDAEEKKPRPGEVIEVLGKISPTEAPRNEGQFDFRLYYRSISVHGSMYGKSFRVIGGAPKPFAEGLQRIRLRMGDILDQLLPEQDAGVYRALLCGDKSAMDADIRSLYQDSGIAHILAVSGLHLSILGMGVYRLLRRCGGSKAVAGIGAAMLIVSYGIFTGCSGSALRAVIMLLIRFLGAAEGRHYDLLSAMAAAALLLLWKEPYMLFGAGFQLSFLAVLSIGLCHELPVPSHPIFEGLWISAYLQLLTLPVILFHFFRFPFYGITLNLIVLPLMSYVIYSGLLGVVLFFLSVRLATIAVGGGHYILRLYTWICKWASALPYSSLLLGRPSFRHIVLYYMALGFLTMMLMKRKKEADDERPGGRSESVRSKRQADRLRRLPRPLLCLPLIIAMFLLPVKAPKGLDVTALDVGQGDGFVLRHQNLVMTVDGGSTSNQSLGKNVLVPYLESQGIGHIDFALITHCDADHYSGILYLLEEEPKITIGELLLSRMAESDARYDRLRNAAEERNVRIRYFGCGDCITLGSVEIKGYYPVMAERRKEANDHSIGMLLRYDDFQMLFTGDMSIECEQEMLRSMQTADGRWPNIDVLKAGHHGSKGSSSEELLEALQPTYALLSYGVGNDYGHPHTETMERFQRYGVQTLKTGEMGEIRISINKEPCGGLTAGLCE